MFRSKSINTLRRILDAAMTVALLFLMAYQVTGEMAHEWIGMGMALLVILHQVLNRKWYSALFRGKYNPYRILSAVLNILLLLSFLLTMFCGMSMSGYAVPFLYGMAPVSFARRMHLSMSHWSFVLMGMHLGVHIPAMTAAWNQRTKTVFSVLFPIAGGIGLYLFLRNGMPDYLLFRVPFAFLDYEKAGWLIFLENLLMLSFWTLLGTQAALLCRNAAQKAAFRKNPLLPLVCLMASVIIALLLRTAVPPEGRTAFSDHPGWGTVQAETAQGSAAGGMQETLPVPEAAALSDPEAVNDGFALIRGGSFLMGSPETENWRIEDETQHEVTVSSFYMDPYETTQEEYIRLIGENPSAFPGDSHPVEAISWLEAVRFANAKSADAGLAPAYRIGEDGVTWDRSAEGYRLPTEAEWEYACRAGTATPFHTEKSLSASEANFYGHYPYEIEENYFNSSVLEAQPGEYRQTTLAAGSFEPNPWGLYDMHGNVSEWCWDYYGSYSLSDPEDPSGPASGTRHVYRGGGWNDFAKNMRSAYRAAGPEDMKSSSLGVRLVRNAGSSRSGLLKAEEKTTRTKSGGKVLIAYFSWSGNTRGIAREIQSQTGADLFEISPVRPYSSDYNTVLMEAQEDQHQQARPELSGHVPNMEDYGTILLGYPNWWASIPMPVASFLEEYDFSGKTILPFCSHGGGRFGQSLTVIAKLAPDAVLGTGLSVHYSGGSSLSSDVAEWLEENRICK